MLEFAEKLTLLPSDMAEEDVAALRRHRFTDREILSITLAAAYRNFITRVADALGVELRQGAAYSAPILNAFGVTEAEAHTTMYGNRLVAQAKQGDASSPPASIRNPAPTAQEICWIQTTDPESAGNTEHLPESERRMAGHLPRNLRRALRLRPEGLEASLAFGRRVGLGGSGLGERLEAIIGFVVAASLRVPYMAAHHAQGLLESGSTVDEVRALVRDPAGGALRGNERSLARFCEKLTRLPSPMARSDLEPLRQGGRNDREILTIVAGTAYENFLGRIAASLGVQLEKEAVASPAFEALV